MKTPRLHCWSASVFLASVLPCLAWAADVKLTRIDDRVRVEIDGALLTEYIFTGASRPYCYPLLAADGTALTRDFPMKRQTGEDQDHPHHRSLWFAHSDVNGVDFWNEDNAGSPRPKGRIVHEALIEATSGAVGIIRARNRWVAPDGRVYCTDDRTMRFIAMGQNRAIDFDVTLRAPPDAPVLFGDNKDGIIALRLAQWLNMPRPKNSNRKFTGGQAQIVTAKGNRDSDAWGKRAEWCDYHAERNGRIYGVAIFDHSQNLRHPTWWHARDYGLVAANPFGWHDFESKTTKANAGDHSLPANSSLTLRYRVYLHMGNEKEAELTARYAEYVAGR